MWPFSFSKRVWKRLALKKKGFSWSWSGLEETQTEARKKIPSSMKSWNGALIAIMNRIIFTFACSWWWDEGVLRSKGTIYSYSMINMHKHLAMVWHAFWRVLKEQNWAGKNEKKPWYWTWVVEFCLNLMNLDILLEKGRLITHQWLDFASCLWVIEATRLC